MRKNYWVSEGINIRPELKNVLNEYLFTLRIANYSYHTISGYRFTLERFLRENPVSLNQLDHAQVREWINRRFIDKKMTTRNNALGALRMFFEYCVQEGHMNRNLVKRYWYGRIPKSAPRFLNKNELAKVQLAAEKLELRDRVLIEFYLSTGCRLSEVVNLDVSDVDLKNRTAQVIGKGSKVRIVYFSEKCALLLTKYLDTHRKDILALFLTYDGTRIGKWSVQKMIKKLGKSAGLSRGLSCHCLRHTFATQLLSKGADLNLISSFLGHTDLNTTRIYANLLSERITQLYHRCMG